MKKIRFDNITHIEEVHSIIGKPPPWLVRFGTIVVVLTISVFVFLLARINYPETIDTSVALTGVSQTITFLPDTGSDPSLPAIRPQNPLIIGKARIPIENREKIKAGQQVILTFRAYPVKRFGFVTAFVGAVPGPSDGDSVMDFTINLPSGLTTNLKKTISYNTGMIASGRIIVSNTSLLKRMWNGLTKQEDR